MSFTYTKLFSSITESTIWVESYPTRILWVAMLAMADQHGRVWGSVPGLARRANITLVEAEQGLQAFLSPDPYSRTPDNEGRRIEAIDGGWRLLNYAKHRAIRDDESQRERKAKNAKDYRERHRAASPGVTGVTDNHRASPQAEADTEANTNKSKKEQKTSRAKRTSDSRHTPFRDALAVYWRHKNPALPELPWQGRDAKALADLLASSPDLTLEQFRVLLNNRAKSAVAHGDRVYLWIAKVTSYSEPLNQFNKPEASNGTSGIDRGGAAGRVARSQSAWDKALAKRLGDSPEHDAAPDAGGIPPPGVHGGDGGYISADLRGPSSGVQRNGARNGVAEVSQPATIFPAPLGSAKGVRGNGS